MKISIIKNSLIDYSKEENTNKHMTSIFWQNQITLGLHDKSLEEKLIFL